MKNDFDRSIRHKTIVYNKLSVPKINGVTNIYHYTSITGLSSILKEKTLRFTNIGYMNDTMEIQTGIESQLLLAKDSAKNKEYYAKIKEVLTNDTFICCFSISNDELPMWNYYTKEINHQGYNIGYNYKNLIKHILKYNKWLDGCYLSFGKVDYCVNGISRYSINQGLEIKKIMFPIISKTIDVTNIINKITGKEQIDIKDFDVKIIGNDMFSFDGRSNEFSTGVKTNDYLCYVKQDYFKPEKEFRIAIRVPEKRIEYLKKIGVYKFTISNGILVPYIDVHVGSIPLKEICISPTINNELIEKSIETYLSYNDYDINTIDINHSKIPVRY